MTKGDVTRQMILERTAPVFNQLGYAGAALSDIMQATGLEKGGIYNHFGSKEQLALEAFDYAISQVARATAEAVKDHEPGLDQLFALLDYYAVEFESPHVPGGCPILNTAVESDDTNPFLRERAQKALSRFQRHYARMLRTAISRGEIRPEVDVDGLSNFVTGAMEGGIMQSKLYGDVRYIKDMAEFLKQHIRDTAAA